MNEIKALIAEQRARTCLVQSDGGRESAGFNHESNDCVVRALSVAYCLPYAVVHEDLRKLGRETGKGISTALVMYGREFIWRKQQNDLHMSVGRFLKEHPIGHYIITVKGHAMAIIDGVIHDNCRFRPNRHVLNAWKVL